MAASPSTDSNSNYNPSSSSASTSMAASPSIDSNSNYNRSSSSASTSMAASPSTDSNSNYNRSSSSASTSMVASPSTDYNSNYDVFLNHRGPDTKKTLASHLYGRLCDRGFRVFLDRSEMKVGDPAPPQIERANATASVHIAIFSPRYAESDWCLNELLQMYNRKLESKTTIIPVFYKVKPSDLRIKRHGLLDQILRFLGCLEGSDVGYDEDLQCHLKKGRCTQQKLEEWKTALSAVSELTGLELEAFNGYEGDLADMVVQRVEEKVKKPQLDVVKYPTGLDKKLQDLSTTVSQQQRQSGETKVVGIVGIVGSGGVGKTTLATEFFCQNRSLYPKSCFLEDVRVEASTSKALMSLQSKLHKGLTSLDLEVSSIADGKRDLSHRLSGSKALIVLDNVDQAKQLDALLSPLKGVLSSDSLILLTSRDRDFLSTNEVSSIYKLSGLDREDSRRLFCRHAFCNHEPDDPGFEEVVTKFLDACDGLPLSLSYFGSRLHEKGLEYWKAELQKISDLVLPTDILSSLRISYDILDRHDQDIFLDIACFFIEEDRELAIRILDGSSGLGRHNLQNLENKSILEIDGKNCIRMHNHLRDLGRDLAEKELPTHHRRLWRPTDNLFHNAILQPIVRGIHMVPGKSGQSLDNSLQHPYVDMTSLRLLRAEGDCLESISQFLRKANDLVWLCWNKCPHISLPNWIQSRKLRALQVSSGQLETWWQSESVVPSKLESSVCADLQTLPDSVGDLGDVRHTSMNGCLRSEMLPSCLGNFLQLEHLDLQGTKIKEVSFPEGFCPALKHLNISFCCELVEVGALPTALISLDLQKCTALKKISGLPGLANLRLLDIRGCNELEELPGLETLKELKGRSECKKLKESRPLDSRGCNQLEELPGLETLTSLKGISECKKLKEIVRSYNG